MFRALLLSLCLLSFGLGRLFAQESAASWLSAGVQKAPEAVQAAAADERHFFAICSTQVAKYDRATGARIAVSHGDAKHLNSGFLWGGKLLCAHSNYPAVPEKSDVRVLDLQSMKLGVLKDFGNFGGSLTWVVRHRNHWWCNFAKYGKDNDGTFLVELDDEWKERGRWHYPGEVIRQLGKYSLSGGVWRGDDLLVTGHDDPMIFRLRLPKSGRILELVDTQPAPFTGQGIAEDPKTGGLIGIDRPKREVVFATLSLERIERFDADPKWDAHNNRQLVPRTIRQDFGLSPTSHAGGKKGELGGFITPAAEPAYYAKRLPKKSFKDRLFASGRLNVTGRQSHVLLGFFNSQSLNEWRTPNTIALRLSGRGDVFYAWLEYCTEKWRAGGDGPVSFPTVRDPQTGRQRLKGFPSNKVLNWSLEYDPLANDGKGVVTATIDGVKSTCHLADGHKPDGATFDRFGLLTVMKSADTGGELWIGDVSLNGHVEDFSAVAGWEGFQNRRSYLSNVVRPHFDFGFNATRFAGGAGSGELGGLIFRGDCRYASKLAHYGDRLNELSLAKPFQAAGKVALRRGVTDSNILIGFFHSKDSTAVTPSQDAGTPKNFAGISTDGPSSEGFLFTPTYRVVGINAGEGQGYGRVGTARFYPDGQSHDWRLSYLPKADGSGEMTLTLDKQRVTLPIPKEHRDLAGRFDRFGIVSTWIDGNSQTIFFDDLRYTWKQD